MSSTIIDPVASSSRRSFIRKGVVASAVGAGLAILHESARVFAKDDGPREDDGNLSKGDAALLRFAAAAEILDRNELGGVRDKEVNPTERPPRITSAFGKFTVTSSKQKTFAKSACAERRAVRARASNCLALSGLVR
jgi:hypothetical protein